jgi:hypothetical protein
MRRITATFALALCFVGCDAFIGAPAPIALRTTDTDISSNCYLAGTAAELILDPSAGLAWQLGPDDIRPVIWPRGYTAQRVGSEIQVLNRDGLVIARSGRTVELGIIKSESGFVYGC